MGPHSFLRIVNLRRHTRSPEGLGKDHQLLLSPDKMSTAGQRQGRHRTTTWSSSMFPTREWQGTCLWKYHVIWGRLFHTKELKMIRAACYQMLLVIFCNKKWHFRELRRKTLFHKMGIPSSFGTPLVNREEGPFWPHLEIRIAPSISIFIQRLKAPLFQKASSKIIKLNVFFNKTLSNI